MTVHQPSQPPYALTIPGFRMQKAAHTPRHWGKVAGPLCPRCNGGGRDDRQLREGNAGSLRCCPTITPLLF